MNDITRTSKDQSTCATHGTEQRLLDTLPCPWCVIDELKRNRDAALQRVDALTLELENTNANLVKAIRAAGEPPAECHHRDDLMDAELLGLAGEYDQSDGAGDYRLDAQAMLKLLRAVADRSAPPPPAGPFTVEKFGSLAAAITAERDWLRTQVPPSPDASIHIGESVRVGPNARGEYGGVMTVTKIMYVLNHGAAMVPDDCVVRATATKEVKP